MKYQTSEVFDPFSILAGAELICAMALVLCTQVIFEHGVSFKINNDRKRQTLLNLICFICSINCTISYGFNATKASLLVTNVTTSITFICVLYGLVILNHNTLVRASIISNVYYKHQKASKSFYFLLYFLPLIVLIPYYFDFARTIPEGIPMNMSPYNTHIYKPINVGLIFITELLASLSDVLLLRKVILIKVTIINAQKFEKQKEIKRSLLRWYMVIWLLIVGDITLKIFIMLGYHLLFDSIVTILTIAIRARVNLMYGLQLQSLY